MPRGQIPTTEQRLVQSAVVEKYYVRIVKEALVFSAAHFITFAGNICERLHGHNYKVAAEVHGPLDENQYVVDFIAVRDALRAIIDELDHHMLLPTGHPQIKVTAGEHQVDVTFEERRWSFPREDCILLPVENTTAELLARYIGRRLQADLFKRTRVLPQRLLVAVDECEGQWGVWESDDAN
jgi:6-pyruvoyltetrahydropterin/6-carboxytetrahydropterin synthase